ncbi:MAG: hypothetical protein WCP14_02345 [bacterium]
MKKGTKLQFIAKTALIIVLQGVFLFSPFVTSAAQNPSYIMPDSVFDNVNSMNEQQIQEFLVARGSYLANYVMPAPFTDSFGFYNGTKIGPFDGEEESTGWTAAHVIAKSASWYGINPQVLLAVLYKEQSWVTPTDSNYDAAENARRLRWATGFAVTDSGVVKACSTWTESHPRVTNDNPTGSCAGFAMQVDWAAGSLRGSYNGSANRNPNTSPYWAGNTVNIGGGSVYIGNNSTAALYRYTPYTPYSNNYTWFFNTFFGNIDYVDPGLAVYRFWNTNGTHFYTASESEKNNVLAKWPTKYRLEGVAYRVNPGDGRNTVPLYRFYNTSNGTHFYTASEAEKNNTIRTLGYKYRLDGVAYNVSVDPSGVPVYRFWNNNGTHFYTASESEKNNVISKLGYQYKYEGVAYYIN